MTRAACIVLLASTTVACDDKDTPGDSGAALDVLTADSRTDSRPKVPPLRHHWHKVIGGTKDDFGSNVAVDSGGNVYLTGNFEQTVDLGGGSITSRGLWDTFVTSFTAAGAHRWQRVLGGTEDDTGRGVAVDGSGNIYLTGGFSGTADLGGGDVTSWSRTDIFVTSFTSTGVHRWQKALRGDGRDSGAGVAVDGSGNVYLTGWFSGVAKLGGAFSVSSKSGSDDIFVTSFTADGSHRWQKVLGGTGDDAGHGVAVDHSGNVYLTGEFKGTADLGGGNVTSNGYSDVFVTSFTSTGDHRWQKAMGSKRHDHGSGVAVDGSGNVYVSVERAYLGVDHVISFTAAGADRWRKSLADSSSVAVDGSGNVYLTGGFELATNLGGGTVTPRGMKDIFVTSFTAAGAHRWQKTMSGKWDEYGTSVTADGSGNLYLSGEFTGAIDLGGGDVTSKGWLDIFVVKLGP
jgi:hypothetical protein